MYVARVYAYRVLAAAAAALCVAILLLLLQLLLFVIVCRMAKLVTDSLNLIRMFSFSSFKHDLFLTYDVPLGSNVAFSASICL